ncbi:MAG: DMT family transporter [Planctomycetes bacterium]|nr:DMT family transporter [Planctomycetota bacterium]
MNNKNLQPYIWILISGFAFSWMATLAPLAGKGCGWQAVAIVRCLVPLILISAWASWDGVQLVFFGSPVLWMRSLAGSCSLVGSFYAFAHLPLTDIYAICNIFPIWVALLSWPMLGRFPSGAVWLSIFCSIIGVALLQGREINAGNLTALVVVGVSIFTALAMMGLNQLKDLDPRAVVVHFSATALIFSVASLVFFPLETTEEAFSAVHLAELLGVGVTASIGQYFLTRAFTAGDPARMSVATLSQFVFILVLDVFVLGNPLEPIKLWGIPLVLGPTLWLMSQRIQEPSAIADNDAEDPTNPSVDEEPEADWAMQAEPVGSNESK